MVIKKGADGKYYVAPSPKSFYQSKQPTPQTTYSGPIQPGTSEKTFRDTGKTTPSYSGPVQPGTDRKTFRDTGKSTPSPTGTPLTPLKDRDKTTTQQTQDAGVLTTTPEEARKIRPSGSAYWTVESTTPAGAIEESGFMGVPQASPLVVGGKRVRTRGGYEYDTRNIEGGKETYRQYKGIVSEFNRDPASFEGQAGVTTTKTDEGTTYGLTSEYFNKNINYDKIDSDALTRAKAGFSNLPGSTRTRLTAGSFGVGASSSVIGIGEFGASVLKYGSTQTMEPGEKRSLLGKGVKFGGTAGKIRNQPATQIVNPEKWYKNPVGWGYQKLAGTPERLGSSAVVVPLVIGGIGGAVRNVKTMGFKGGALETVSSISPLKIRPGTYAQGITKDTKFDIKSFKTTNKGMTTRTYSGRTGSVEIYGYEKGGASGGGGFVSTKTPTMTIGGGGTSVSFGTRTTINSYVFKPSGSGKAFKYSSTGAIIKGGTTNVLRTGSLTEYNTGGKSTFYYKPQINSKMIKGGSAFKPLNNKVTRFASGNAESGYFTYNGRNPISQAGQYRFKPKVSGREYDLTGMKFDGIKFKFGDPTATSGASGGGYSSSGGGGLKLKIQAPTQTISGVGTTVPILKTAPKPISTFLPPQLKAPRSQYYGKGQYEKTDSLVLIKNAPKINAPGLQMDAPGLKVDAPGLQMDAPGLLLVDAPRIQGRKRQNLRAPGQMLKAPGLILVDAPKQNLRAPGQRILLQAPGLKLKLVQKIRFPQQDSYFNYGGGSPYVPGYTPTLPVPIIPSLPFMAGGGSPFMRLGNVKARPSPTRYAPSFKALFFKIKGKAPQGRRTGFQFRPITPGFSFQGVRRVRRVRIR